MHGVTWPSFAFARFFSHWVLLPRDLNKLFDLFSLSQDSKVRPEKGIFHTVGRDEIKLLVFVSIDKQKQHFSWLLRQCLPPPSPGPTVFPQPPGSGAQPENDRLGDELKDVLDESKHHFGAFRKYTNSPDENKEGASLPLPRIPKEGNPEDRNWEKISLHFFSPLVLEQQKETKDAQ